MDFEGMNTMVYLSPDKGPVTPAGGSTQQFNISSGQTYAQSVVALAPATTTVLATISSVTGGGVTWQKAARSNTNTDSEVWYGLNASGSGTSVTSTLSSACTGSCIINISEWSGMATSSAIDATSTRNGTSATLIVSPTSTTSNTQDLIIATERHLASSPLVSGPTGSFTALQTASSSVGNSAYALVATTLSTSTSWTVTSSVSFDSVITAFKAIAPTSTSNATIRYVLTDHLGGTTLLTDTSGNIQETLDYYPYGASRLDTKAGSYQGEKRKYIGQQYDSDTQLSYFNARYYEAARGQFISEDPIFVALGSPSAEQMAQQKLQDILSNPQQLNAYSYALDNPITREDPSGKASLSSLLSQLSSALQQLSVLVARVGVGSASTVSGAVATPVASSLFNHSLSNAPSAVTVTQGNQGQYGNVINKIEKAPEFNSYVEKAIKKNGQSGSINESPGNTDSMSFNLSQSPDLFLGLGKVNVGLTGSQSNGGSWNLNVVVQDTYNFEYHDYSGGYGNQAATTLNNAAYYGQQGGIINQYPVNIQFNYQYSPQ